MKRFEQQNIDVSSTDREMHDYLSGFQEEVPDWLTNYMLRDHGLGGNYDMFGKGGLLDQIIKVNRCKPEFVICENAPVTEIWYGFQRIEDINPIIGGIHHNIRYLYRRRKVQKGGWLLK